MKTTDKYEDHGALFYQIELEENVFVDVKCVESLCYVIDCEDGYQVYDNNGNTFDYCYDECEVLEFVKECERAKDKSLDTIIKTCEEASKGGKRDTTEKVGIDKEER